MDYVVTIRNEYIQECDKCTNIKLISNITYL